MVDAHYVRYKNRYKVKNPNRGKHLESHQWKPGQSGNPTGRPNGTISLVERLRAYLRRHPEDMDKIIESLVALGKNQSAFQLQAIDKIIDRVDGKATETHRIEGELPVRIEFVPARELLEEKQSARDEGVETPCEGVEDDSAD